VDPVEVVAGTEFDVPTLDLPGAGYRWEVPEVPPGLAFLGSDWAQSEPPPGVGAGRARILRFRADQTGEYVVRLELRRPWEDAPTRVDELSVHVTDRPVR
jgi:predicted secreted protein